MKTALRLIWATRPKTTGMAAALVVVSHILVALRWDLLMALQALFVLVGGGATMTINDWWDREKDALQGKRLASDAGVKFLYFAIFLWVVTGVLALSIYFLDENLGKMCFVLMVLGVLYNALLRVPFLPAVYVAIVSTGPVVLTYIRKPSILLVFLALLVFGYIWARELLKDNKDVEVDKSEEGDVKKWTIPSHIGVRKTKTIIAVVYLIIAVLVGGILFGLPFNPILMYGLAVGVSVLLGNSVLLFIGFDSHKSKNIGDLGLMVVMAAIIGWYLAETIFVS